MKKRPIICAYFLLVILVAQTGICQSIEGWKQVGKSLKFQANDLYGHINGGAELFLEFGFEELSVDAYAMDSEEIEIELYRMSSPVSALGIYLMKCGEEKPSRLIKARNTCTKYQVTALKNNCFIQLNNFGGQKDNWSDQVALLNHYLKEIPAGKEINIFKQLPSEELIAGSEKLIRGQYGLQSIYTLGADDILQLENKTFALVARYLGQDDSVYTRIYVPYANNKLAGNSYSNLKSNLDSYIQVLKSDQKHIIFKDYRNQFGIISLQDNVIDIKVNLRKEPKL